MKLTPFLLHSFVNAVAGKPFPDHRGSRNDTKLGSGYGSKPVDNGGGSFTITIVNKHTEAIIAWNANDPSANVPKLVAGRADSIIPPNEMSTYVVNGKWSGGFQINTAANGISGKDSLIEGSMVQPQGLFLDVSNVPGYTMPIVCGCEPKGMTVGCNKDLKALYGGCPVGTDNGHGCVNNHAEENFVHEFYQPCNGGSYAHTLDHSTQNDGLCNNEAITCCVGTNCPDSYKQPNAVNTGFHVTNSSENFMNFTTASSGNHVSIFSPDFRPTGMQILPGGSVQSNSTSGDNASTASGPYGAHPGNVTR